MHLHETILCSTSSTSFSGQGFIVLHDIQTGSSLASFKQTSALPHCTAFLPSRHGEGGVMIAAQADKSTLNVYNFQKDQLSLKMVLPEKLSCTAIDPAGYYFAGGTLQGRIYVWEIASGVMFNAWDAHYRGVSVLQFTRDGAALLSGSEDSGVSVWSVARLVDEDLKNELPHPFCTLSDHTLPVTDIACGAVGHYPNYRVLTASLDHSVKLWDLATQSLLTSLQFPAAISCVAWDPTERVFFAASSREDGAIFQVNLFRSRDDKFGSMEAVGGAGTLDIIRFEEDEEEHKKRIIAVGSQVTAISLSLTSTLLIAGTSSGLINIYDTSSHQLMRCISSHKDKGISITSLATLLRPPDLVGHTTLTTGSAGKNSEMWVPKPVQPFQRMRDTKSREAREIVMRLPNHRLIVPDLDYNYAPDELTRDHSFFFPSTSSADVASSSSASSARLSALEAEVADLRAQLARAGGVNDAMWENVVKKVFKGTASESNDVDVDQSDRNVNGDRERKRKRGGS